MSKNACASATDPVKSKRPSEKFLVAGFLSPIKILSSSVNTPNVPLKIVLPVPKYLNAHFTLTFSVSLPCDIVPKLTRPPATVSCAVEFKSSVGGTTEKKGL